MEVREAQAPAQRSKDGKKEGLPGSKNRQAQKERQLRLRCLRFNVHSLRRAPLQG